MSDSLVYSRTFACFMSQRECDIHDLLRLKNTMWLTLVVTGDSMTEQQRSDMRNDIAKIDAQLEELSPGGTLKSKSS